MLKISAAEVDRLTKLARLELTNGEKNRLVRQLAEIINFVDQLSRVTLGDAVAAAAKNLSEMREDEIGGERLSVKEIAALSPEFEGDQVAVPPVLEESNDV